MLPYVEQNKRAWEYDAYHFWCQNCTPQEQAKLDLEDPVAMLRKYANYFDSYKGVKIAPAGKRLCRWPF